MLRAGNSKGRSSKEVESALYAASGDGTEGRRLTLKERAARLEPSHLPPHFAEVGLAYLCPVADEDPAPVRGAVLRGG